MQLQSFPIKGLFVIQPKVFLDARGFFFESYRKSRYADAGIDVEFVQDNVSFSQKNTVRGLHYQAVPGQAKLISVLQGCIWDVAVDIRPQSPTCGQWQAIELSADNYQQFFIPVGFAHGYCVLSDTARVQYKVSAPYDPKEERSILWNDPALAVAWPVSHPILSDRDRQAPLFQRMELP
ncbi:MAG: rfbC [Parachlamydiales bacterium]|nr:rfbC [Parachlamydiales bacterium]